MLIYLLLCFRNCRVHCFTSNTQEKQTQMDIFFSWESKSRYSFETANRKLKGL